MAYNIIIILLRVYIAIQRRPVSPTRIRDVVRPTRAYSTHYIAAARTHIILLWTMIIMFYNILYLYSTKYISYDQHLGATTPPSITGTTHVCGACNIVIGICTFQIIYMYMTYQYTSYIMYMFLKYDPCKNRLNSVYIKKSESRSLYYTLVGRW